jgi:hypothetical protein
MSRIQNLKAFQIKALRNNLMGYIHGQDANFEHAFRFLLNQAHEIYEEMSSKNHPIQPGERRSETWKLLFNELTFALSPLQIQQLFERFTKDVLEMGVNMAEMAESQKILQKDVGGQSG